MMSWSGSIHELGADYFDQNGRLISEFTADKVVILLFYSPKCPHCVHMKPSYNQASEQIGGSNGIEFAVIDATANPSLFTSTNAWPYKIGGYPTIVAYKNGVYLETYKGDRSTKSFIDFAQKCKGLSATTPKIIKLEPNYIKKINCWNPHNID